jgi:hypothetical protein
MREFRGDRAASYAAERGDGGRDAAKARGPEEEASTRVYRLRQEVESAALRAQRLAAIVQRDPWRTERAALTKTHAALTEQLAQRTGDAQASSRAHAHHAAMTMELEEIATALASATEPRGVPAVAGEEAIEPQILSRSAGADDVLAWVSGLGVGERRGLAERVRSVQGSADRSDGFAVGLANYLASTRLLSQFHGVVEDPRRFRRAEYDKRRAPSTAANAPTMEAECAASAAAPTGTTREGWLSRTAALRRRCRTAAS